MQDFSEPLHTLTWTVKPQKVDILCCGHGNLSRNIGQALSFVCSWLINEGVDPTIKNSVGLSCYTHKVPDSGDYVVTRVSSRILPDGQIVHLQAQDLPLVLPRQQRGS